MGLVGRYCIATATTVLLISACGERGAPDAGSERKAATIVSAGPSARGDAFILNMDFNEALNRLDTAAERKDAQFFRDQWSQVETRENRGMDMASKSRLALTARLAELVQVHAPGIADDARSYLIELSTSKFASHREAAARAMRESEGRDAVEALFARSIDTDSYVSLAALEALRWKYESAAMHGASAASVEDARLISQNLGRLCSDPRLPDENLRPCKEITQSRP
jgi:hypothetical protein